MRAAPPHEDLSVFLARVPPPLREVVDRLRQLIRRAAPATAETVLWGSLSYHRPSLGGRIKGAVCLITLMPDGVHLAFIHGVALADPDHLLRGAGVAKRFVRIRNIRDMDAHALARLIQAANQYDPRL